MANKFAAGNYALGVCDICGFQFKLKELKMLMENDRPANLLVCDECWNEEHPQDDLGKYPVHDPQALENPRPDVGMAESRKIHWGWSPVAPSNVPLTPSATQIEATLGTVTVEIS